MSVSIGEDDHLLDVVDKFDLLENKNSLSFRFASELLKEIRKSKVISLINLLNLSIDSETRYCLAIWESS